VNKVLFSQGEHQQGWVMAWWWLSGADLADSHDTVSSQDGPLQDVDGRACHCCPVWELPFQHIPPAQKGKLKRQIPQLQTFWRQHQKADFFVAGGLESAEGSHERGTFSVAGSLESAEGSTERQIPHLQAASRVHKAAAGSQRPQWLHDLSLSPQHLEVPKCQLAYRQYGLCFRFRSFDRIMAIAESSSPAAWLLKANKQATAEFQAQSKTS